MPPPERKSPNASRALGEIRTSTSGIVSKAISRVAAKASASSTMRTVRAIDSLRQKAIAHAVHREEMMWICRVRFQLLPQPDPVRVHRPGIRIQLLSPHRVPDDGSRQGPATV